MIFTAKYRRKPKRLRLLAIIKKLKASTEVKNCIRDQMLSENICRNINHSN